MFYCTVSVPLLHCHNPHKRKELPRFFFFFVSCLDAQRGVRTVDVCVIFFSFFFSFFARLNSDTRYFNAGVWRVGTVWWWYDSVLFCSTFCSVCCLGDWFRLLGGGGGALLSPTLTCPGCIRFNGVKNNGTFFAPLLVRPPPSPPQKPSGACGVCMCVCVGLCMLHCFKKTTRYEVRLCIVCALESLRAC